MSANPEAVAEELLNIEIDGAPYKARKGAMIIEVADQAGIAIPRFCYHKKLPIAANCRMCMVEVEKAPKPMPACATPVMEGMKIFTTSDRAKSAQRAVMEFLLINHPLDCPICDQGGECELQDLALGYGRSISRFTEKKRVVKDKNIGPLIATDMTRCIHCTRCIRFLEIVGGKKELGSVGRGENLEIGTYIEQSINSEMSGNIIDVCPVGALTSKPFRFKARAWELSRQESIAPHDSVGSNIDLHSLRNRVMRVVPGENEEINEVWLSDRDRFSYQGLYSEDRLQHPMRKIDGEWQEVDWEEALDAAITGIRNTIDAAGAEQLGMLVSPTATLEEMYLLNRLAEGLGCSSLDHRLRQTDFSDQDRAPLFPWLGQSISDLEKLDAALIIGSNLRKEQPIIAHRLRKAAEQGAQILFVNPVDFDFHEEATEGVIVPPLQMVNELAAIAVAVLEKTGATGSRDPGGLLANAQADTIHKSIAQKLLDGGTKTVLLGNVVTAHPALSAIRALAALIAEQCGATLGYLGEAANSSGACLAGVLPHRGPGGEARASKGLDAGAMIEHPRSAYLLFGLEPEHDCWAGADALAAIKQALFVVSCTSYVTEYMREYADVLLPLASFAETSGTFVNTEGRWQSFAGASKPLGDARPGWKILRVLGNLLDLADFDYNSSTQIRDELKNRIGSSTPDNSYEPGDVVVPEADGEMQRMGNVPMYALDPLVRRADALQQTAEARDATVRICQADAERLGLVDAGEVLARQGTCEAALPLEIDARVPAGCAWIPAACPGSKGLGASIGSVELTGIE